MFVVLLVGSFELAVLRMSRYFDLSQNCVLYADTLLPQEAFFTTETAEMKLVTCVFEFAKGVAELKLTETELALYSACVLLSAGVYGISLHAVLNGKPLCLGSSMGIPRGLSTGKINCW